MAESLRAPVLGLVGGIGSGKSALARCVAARRPVVVVDGDRAGHAVLSDPAVKDELRASFGDGIFTSDGAVDRRRLAQLVFGPSQHHREARSELERIVHPRIRHDLLQQINDARSDGCAQNILLDAAVLFEAGWNDLCDAIAFVEVPEAIRRERVRLTRGWTADDLANREASQKPLESKRAAADYVVDNSASLRDAAAQLESILDRLTRPTASQQQEEGNSEQINGR